eukprot:scaffold2969_cov129-Skeletonema_dohrnii-CCMP3373.AAC.2
MQQNNSNANVPDANAVDEDEEKDVEGGGRYCTLPVSLGDEKHSGNPMRVSYSDGSLSTLAKRSVASIRRKQTQKQKSRPCCPGQMKNEDEEVAINRRVSFHHDGGSAVTSTHQTNPPRILIFQYFRLNSSSRVKAGPPW